MNQITGKITASNELSIKGRLAASGITGSTGSGVDYYKGDKGEDGRDGIDGVNGKDGRDGVNGKDGYTPIKGVDYFTQADIEEIIDQIDIPPSYEMATSNNMSDWNNGKVVDAGTLKFCFFAALAQLRLKADTASLNEVAFSGDYDDLSNKPTLITENRVNELIEAKLGVIENGTY